MKNNDCATHAVIVQDGSGLFKKTHNFKHIPSLSCMNTSGYKYVDLMGDILHTKLYDFEHHPESQHLSGGNTIYKATAAPGGRKFCKDLDNLATFMSPTATCENWYATTADECYAGYSCAYDTGCRQCKCEAGDPGGCLCTSYPQGAPDCQGDMPHKPHKPVSQCVASYGAKIGDPVCCQFGQPGGDAKNDGRTVLDLSTVCDKEKPTCSEYIDGTQMGKCT